MKLEGSGVIQPSTLEMREIPLSCQDLKNPPNRH